MEDLAEENTRIGIGEKYSCTCTLMCVYVYECMYVHTW